MPTYTVTDPRGNAIVFAAHDIEAAKDRGFAWIRAGYVNQGTMTANVRSDDDSENTTITIDTTRMDAPALEPLGLRAAANIVRTALGSAPGVYRQRVAQAIDTVCDHAAKCQLNPLPFKAGARQRQQIIDLLWEQLPQVRGDSSKRMTTWGYKSQSGLVECIETIVNDTRGR